jgi:hypothetical protein
MSLASFQHLASTLWGMVGGGFVSFVAALFSERKRDLRDLESLGIDVRAEVGTYWRNTGLDDQLEQALVRLTHKFQSRAIAFARTYVRGTDVTAARTHLAAILRICTGGQFAVAGRVSDPTRIALLDLELRKLYKGLRANMLLGTLRQGIPIGRTG